MVLQSINRMKIIRLFSRNRQFFHGLRLFCLWFFLFHYVSLSSEMCESYEICFIYKMLQSVRTIISSQLCVICSSLTICYYHILAERQSILFLFIALFSVLYLLMHEMYKRHIMHLVLQYFCYLQMICPIDMHISANV